MKLEKQISCCSINIQHLQPIGKIDTMNGIIYMINKEKQAKGEKILRKN